MLSVGDLHKVMAPTTRLARLIIARDRLHHDAGRIGRNRKGGADDMGAGRCDDGRADSGAKVFLPARHGAAIQRDAGPREFVLLAMIRHAFEQFLHDERGPHRRAGDATWQQAQR